MRTVDPPGTVHRHPIAEHLDAALGPDRATAPDQLNRYLHSLHTRHRRMQIREATVRRKARAAGWPEARDGRFEPRHNVTQPDLFEQLGRAAMALAVALLAAVLAVGCASSGGNRCPDGWRCDDGLLALSRDRMAYLRRVWPARTPPPCITVRWGDENRAYIDAALVIVTAGPELAGRLEHELAHILLHVPAHLGAPEHPSHADTLYIPAYVWGWPNVAPHDRRDSDVACRRLVGAERRA